MELIIVIIPAIAPQTTEKSVHHEMHEGTTLFGIKF